MPELTKVEKAREYINNLRDELDKLDVNVEIIVWDGNEKLVIGNGCSCCALEALEEYIDRNDLVHISDVN